MYGVLLILNYDGVAMDHIDGFATKKDAEDFGNQFAGSNNSRRFYVYELAENSRKKPNGNSVELNWPEEELVNKIVDISLYLGSLVDMLGQNPHITPYEMEQAIRTQMLADDIKCHAMNYPHAKDV